MEDIKLTGYVLCLAKTSNSWGKQVISVEVQCPATYTSDWQKDAECWHDEGFIDFNINDAEPIDDTIYKVALLDGDFVEGEGKIEKIIQFLDWDLNEE